MAGLLPLCAAALLLLLLLPAGGAIPPPEEAARMARFVLHNCDWGALATLSAQEGLRGRPFANIFSLSDGPPGPFSGSGVPYLYLTDMEISVQDLEVSGSRRAAGGVLPPRPAPRGTGGCPCKIRAGTGVCEPQAQIVAAIQEARNIKA